jgi:hypothetical protein
LRLVFSGVRKESVAATTKKTADRFDVRIARSVGIERERHGKQTKERGRSGTLKT